MNFITIDICEMKHLFSGFDDEGRQFDKFGNLVDWWQSDTAIKFATKAQCIVDQVIISFECRKFYYIIGR